MNEIVTFGKRLKEWNLRLFRRRQKTQKEEYSVFCLIVWKAEWFLKRHKLVEGLPGKS